MTTELKWNYEPPTRSRYNCLIAQCAIIGLDVLHKACYDANRNIWITQNGEYREFDNSMIAGWTQLPDAMPLLLELVAEKEVREKQ